jgi:large subunit ribosomal protein L22
VPGLKTNERPGTRAVLRHCRMSAYKVRQVLDLIRGVEYDRAKEILEFCERDAAIVVGKLLDSAVANAAHNEQLDPTELFVSACFADEGTTLKRWRPRARGRATRIRKRSCHITVIVARLPEDELRRRRAKVVAEQADRRARRVAGARRARKAAGDEENARIRRSGAADYVEEDVVDGEGDEDVAEDEFDDETEEEFDGEPTDDEPTDDEPTGEAEDEDGADATEDDAVVDVVEAEAAGVAGDEGAETGAEDTGAEDTAGQETSASVSEEED